jgi:bidirectional [NiFe] hydrogenase diaphorase subunit
MHALLNRTSQMKEADRKDPRFKRLTVTMASYGRHPSALIQTLHQAQELYGYLSLPLLHAIATEFRMPPSRVYGVATFYHFFRLKPPGKHHCVVCLGTACYVKGGQKVLEAITQTFKLKTGETTPDGKLSLQTVRCIGSCGLAPLVLFDGEVLARVDPGKAPALLQSKLGEKP